MISQQAVLPTSLGKKSATVNDYIIPLRKYATFSGRASRREFWRFIIPCVAIGAVLNFTDLLNGTAKPGGFGLYSGIFALLVFLPTTAACVRRLHDTGRRGYWVLLGIIPWVGSIVTFILYALPGHIGDNRFGPDPYANAPTVKRIVA